MLSGLPILAGLQLLLAFLSFDIAAVPRRPIHPALDVAESITKPALANNLAPSTDVGGRTGAGGTEGSAGPRIPMAGP
jgi:hypothetical protein